MIIKLITDLTEEDLTKQRLVINDLEIIVFANQAEFDSYMVEHYPPDLNEFY